MKTEISQYKTVKGIQSNETKQEVRDAIDGQIIDTAKQNKMKVNLLSLPSTEWVFEKGDNNNIGLIDYCKKNNVKLHITGIENSMEREVFEAFEKNAPKNAVKVRGEFDDLAMDFVNKGINVIWADYCGNPAESTLRENGTYSFHYPHITLFRKIAEEATAPMLIYLTFSCHGRIKGGKKAMMKALCPSASSVPSAIVNKISQTICMYGLSEKVTRVLSFHYRGTGHHNMLTLGYAINFKPKFSSMRVDLVGMKQIKKKIAMTAKTVKIDYVAVKKEAMKALCDLGWNNEKIAHALNTQKGKVASVLAWHKHRDSWQKVA